MKWMKEVLKWYPRNGTEEIGGSEKRVGSTLENPCCMMLICTVLQVNAFNLWIIKSAAHIMCDANNSATANGSVYRCTRSALFVGNKLSTVHLRRFLSSRTKDCTTSISLVNSSSVQSFALPFRRSEIYSLHDGNENAKKTNRQNKKKIKKSKKKQIESCVRSGLEVGAAVGT